MYQFNLSHLIIIPDSKGMIFIPMVRVTLNLVFCLISLIGFAQNYAAPVSADAGMGSNNTVVGEDAGNNSSAAASGNSLYGYRSGNSLTTGSSNSFFGTLSGAANTTGASNSFFGASTGISNTTGSYNSFFGQNSGQFNIDGGNNSFFGHNSGYNNVNGNRNSFFGQNSGLGNISGSDNSFFGEESGSKNTFGNNNSFFGQNSGAANVDGSDNSFFGQNAGAANTSASSNSFFGQNAGAANTTGAANSFFGEESGVKNESGIFNSFFGQESGSENTTGEGNSFFGTSTGSSNILGHGNSYFGYEAGDNLEGSRNICIGHTSGPTTLSNVSDRLYIDVVRTDTPLIYGEFDKDLIRINGEFEVMGGMSQGSSVRIKEDIVAIDDEVILQQVRALPVSEWQYIGDDRRHIGPMAQDFYKAFGLGGDDTKISAIDADGVMMSAIKALVKQHRSTEVKSNTTIAKQQEMINDLEIEIAILKSQLSEVLVLLEGNK